MYDRGLGVVAAAAVVVGDVVTVSGAVAAVAESYSFRLLKSIQSFN